MTTSGYPKDFEKFCSEKGISLVSMWNDDVAARSAAWAVWKFLTARTQAQEAHSGDAVAYKTGNPNKVGVYACKVPFDAMERPENSRLTRNEFLMWHNDELSYCGSDQRFRGTLLGWIGPLPKIAASAPNGDGND